MHVKFLALSFEQSEKSFVTDRAKHFPKFHENLSTAFFSYPGARHMYRMN